MGKLIALITDFGTSDIYVGVMKAVMKKIHPSAEFIDISHEVKRQSIHDGAFMLRNAYQYFPKDTVFLVVIDPTVGSKRRPILVETEDYRNGNRSFRTQRRDCYSGAHIANISVGSGKPLNGAFGNIAIRCQNASAECQSKRTICAQRAGENESPTGEFCNRGLRKQVEKQRGQRNVDDEKIHPGETA